MLELERTFLAKSLPPGLERCRSAEIIDLYVPRDGHAVLRIRQFGDRFEITKKMPLQQADRSRQEEQTIPLTGAEFAALSTATGKRVHKIRHFYPWAGGIAEIDVFQGPLQGLVLVDVEFPSDREKAAFRMPDFCLADVTQELFAAGGMLCGKSYADIAEELARFGYRKIQ
ncbi:MAG: hypothetical protein HY369_00630 [Candidatus Aenigmarchaeota archaeon]|nr:hypothetical protein [Candidatus Aenigmarchaeota archaeon]